jgi:hypothetical protein
MVEGIEIPAPNDMTRELKRLAASVIETGPALMPRPSSECAISFRTIDDLRAPRSPDELIGTGDRLPRAAGLPPAASGPLVGEGEGVHECFARSTRSCARNIVGFSGFSRRATRRTHYRSRGTSAAGRRSLVRWLSGRRAFYMEEGRRGHGCLGRGARAAERDGRDVDFDPMSLHLSFGRRWAVAGFGTRCRDQR